MQKFQTEDGRGFGVRTLTPIAKGQNVLEYRGELVSHDEAEHREITYKNRGDADSYMFWFQARKGKKTCKMCIDATETDHISRFVNHNRKRPNLEPKLEYQMIDGMETPQIWFRAKRSLKQGEELLFDYGDRRKAVLEALPWLKE